MNNRKTDNSYINEKVKLRLDNLPDKKYIKVLDCYSGDGRIWNNIKTKTDKKIDVMSIDTKSKNRVYIKTDNRKVLISINLDSFDIIDLDAYGVPFDQVEILFNKLYKGIVFITFIQSGFGMLPKRLLYSLGFTKTMINKIPTLFNKNGFDKFCEYLSNKGIKKIQYYQTEDKRKSYIYFRIN